MEVTKINIEEKNLKKWEKIKTKGKWSYITNMSIIYYGIAVFIIWVLIIPSIKNNPTFKFINNETFSTKLNFYIIIAPLLGMLMGYIKYKRFEKKYE